MDNERLRSWISICLAKQHCPKEITPINEPYTFVLFSCTDLDPDVTSSLVIIRNFGADVGDVGVVDELTTHRTLQTSVMTAKAKLDHHDTDTFQTVTVTAL